DSSFVIAALDPDLIDTIYYKNENADITLVLEDDTWVYTEEKERPINKYYVSYLINIIDSIRAERVVNENPEDLSLYGLDSPKAIIKGSQPDGKTVALMIGEKTTAGDGHYVKLENDDTVYLVKRIPETHLSFSLTDMTDIEHGPSIETNNIYHIEIIQSDKEDFELIYDVDSKYHIAATPYLSWAILKPYETAYAADSTKVSEFLTKYSSFNFSVCIDYNAEDFAQYGLEDPKASIFIEYYEKRNEKLDEPEIDPDTGEEITSRTVKDEKSFRLYIGERNEDGDYYVRKEGDNAVYIMKASNLDSKLEADAFDMLSKFVNIYNIETINNIDIDINGVLYNMKIERDKIINDEGEEEIKKTYYYNWSVADEEVFKDVYQVMISALIDTQLDEVVSVSGKEPVLTLTYYVEGYDEPFKTSYYPYDESFYLIDNGTPVRFVADKRKIDAIIKAVQEFKLTD
ncbi:MAG TPA: DUF4340 domain-containing protein, partial [Clostridiales bacterium]|nr:DUF4340 domain-containing protein [Clostridiales bacterium]